MHNLKVVWSEDGPWPEVRNRREGQVAFTEDVSRVTDGLDQIEATQADLLLQLWLEDSSSSSDRLGGGAEQQQQQQAEEQQQQAPPHPAQDVQQGPASAPAAAEQPAPPGRYLRQFLQHLIDKNHGAMMHVPPPGLSDQTCLVAAAFALLRLLNEHVSAALPEVPTLLRWEPAHNFLQVGRWCSGGLGLTGGCMAGCGASSFQGMLRGMCLCRCLHASAGRPARRRR